MAYTNSVGFYYNFIINGLERDFGPSYLSGLQIKSSIFELYPSVKFKILNIRNALFQQGIFKPKSDLIIEFGESAESDTLEKYEPFVLEKTKISEARSDLSGAVETFYTSPSKDPMMNLTPEKGWAKKKTSEIIEEIMSKYCPNRNIEQTKTKGNFIKPSCQSEYEFLKILKNRSLPLTSNDSKMFSWIGLDGTYNFKSLSSLTQQKSKLTLDFTNPDTEYFAPVAFEYLDGGIRYNKDLTNDGFQEYEIDKEEGILKDLPKPNIKGVDKTSMTVDGRFDQGTSVKSLRGYSHKQLPLKYFQSMYYNNYYNFPFRLAFRMKNYNGIQPGDVIFMVFPDYDDVTIPDPHLSGNYLITGISKQEIGNEGVMTLNVAKNDYLAELPDSK
jgi:hypothetical protein